MAPSAYKNKKQPLALTIAKVCGVTVEEVFYLQEEDNDGK